MKSKELYTLVFNIFFLTNLSLDDYLKSQLACAGNDLRVVCTKLRNTMHTLLVPNKIECEQHLFHDLFINFLTLIQQQSELNVIASLLKTNSLQALKPYGPHGTFNSLILKKSS